MHTLHLSHSIMAWPSSSLMPHGHSTMPLSLSSGSTAVKPPPPLLEGV